MTLTRRELSALLPSFSAVSGAFAENPVLPSKCYPYDNLQAEGLCMLSAWGTCPSLVIAPVLTAKTNTETHNQARAVLDGQTHAGVPIELHITTLAPGQMPHPAHQHLHEEMIMLQEGMLEVTILGESTRIGPGSVAYVRSNDLHGWKNVGAGPAQYFVLAIGKDTA